MYGKTDGTEIHERSAEHGVPECFVPQNTWSVRVSVASFAVYCSARSALSGLIHWLEFRYGFFSFIMDQGFCSIKMFVLRYTSGLAFR